MDKLLIPILVIGAFIAGLQIPKINQKTTTNTSVDENKKTNCVPAFVDGGGPYYKPNTPFRKALSQQSAFGEKLIVEGRVLQNDCKTPLSNAVIDIWHSDENGKYQDDWYRGKIRANKNGNYSFQTVIPKGYGEGTGYRPPHIHFKIFVDDKEIITSQMFFPDVAGKAGFDDAYIMRVTKNPHDDSVQTNAYHDIIVP